MSLLTIFFAALLIVANTASIPRIARQATDVQSSSLALSPSPSPFLSQSTSATSSTTPEVATALQSAQEVSSSVSQLSSSSTSVEANDLSTTTTPTPSPTVLPPVEGLSATVLSGAALPSAQAPSSAGAFLGRVGVETPDFQSECLKCCSYSVQQFSSVFPILRSCHACALNKNLEPPSSGSCSNGAALGFARTPTSCFYDRCHKMLQARTTSCMCLGNGSR